MTMFYIGLIIGQRALALNLSSMATTDTFLKEHILNHLDNSTYDNSKRVMVRLPRALEDRYCCNRAFDAR